MPDLSQKIKIFIARVGRLKMHDLESTLDTPLMTILTHSLSMPSKFQMSMETTFHHSILSTQLMELPILEFLTHSTLPMLAKTLLLFTSLASMLRQSELL